jgi:hypothetical protein
MRGLRIRVPQRQAKLGSRPRVGATTAQVCRAAQEVRAYRLRVAPGRAAPVFTVLAMRASPVDCRRTRATRERLALVAVQRAHRQVEEVRLQAVMALAAAAPSVAMVRRRVAPLARRPSLVAVPPVTPRVVSVLAELVQVVSARVVLARVVVVRAVLARVVSALAELVQVVSVRAASARVASARVALVRVVLARVALARRVLVRAALARRVLARVVLARVVWARAASARAATLRQSLAARARLRWMTCSDGLATTLQMPSSHSSSPRCPTARAC